MEACNHTTKAFNSGVWRNYIRQLICSTYQPVFWYVCIVVPSFLHDYQSKANSLACLTSLLCRLPNNFSDGKQSVQNRSFQRLSIVKDPPSNHFESHSISSCFRLGHIFIVHQVKRGFEPAKEYAAAFELFLSQNKLHMRQAVNLAQAISCFSRASCDFLYRPVVSIVALLCLLSWTAHSGSCISTEREGKMWRNIIY